MREIKKRIIDILDQQEQKGMQTYGHGLEECPDHAYNWDVMALEEMVDALQYQIKKNLIMEKQIRKLQTQLAQYSAVGVMVDERV